MKEFKQTCKNCCCRKVCKYYNSRKQQKEVNCQHHIYDGDLQY